MLRVAFLHACIATIALLLLGVPRAIGAQTAAAAIDPIVLKERAMQVMESHCVSCHGPDKQKGKVRLDALETIDPVDLQALYGTAREVVHFEDMPPAEESQPSAAERQVLLQWLDSQLTGKASKALAEKLLRFEYGNVVKHEDLFSGKHAHLPGYTHDRRWMISEYIFTEKVNRLLDYKPTRTIYGTERGVAGDSGVHWSPKTEHGDKFRRTITNPFLLPQKVGVRYHGKEALTTGHLLTMVANAKRIAGHMTSEAAVRAHHPAMFALLKDELQHREILRTREAFLSTDSYMERLLQEIYGDEHEALLPELVRVDVAFPGMRNRKFPGEKTYRIGRAVVCVSSTLGWCWILSVSELPQLAQGLSCRVKGR